MFADALSRQSSRHLYSAVPTSPAFAPTTTNSPTEGSSTRDNSVSPLLHARRATKTQAGLEDVTLDDCCSSVGSNRVRLADLNVYQSEEVQEELRKVLMDQGIQKEDVNVPHWKKVGRRVLNSMLFQGCMALMILSNAVVIGLETDFTDFPGDHAIEDCFLLVFIVELLVKFVVLGPHEFLGPSSPEFTANIFDISIVSVGIFDSVSQHILANTPGGRGRMNHHAFTLLRMLRLLRILRIFRIVRFMKHLYLLAHGFALAVVAVFWVTILMLFILYVCGIILVRTLGRVNEDDPNFEFLHERFGSIPISMLTLFELMSNPDLGPYQEVLFRFPFFTAFTILFIIFGSFGMLAVLTGVISESMFAKNMLRLQEEQTAAEERRKDLLKKCGDLFDSIAKYSSNGEAPAAAFKTILKPICEAFRNQGVLLSQEDMQSMVEIIDADGSGYISREEFRHFLLQMTEGVRPILIMEIYYAVCLIKEKVEEQSVVDRKVHDKVKHISTSQKRMMSDLEQLSTNLGNLMKCQENMVQRQEASMVLSKSMHQGMIDLTATVKAAPDHEHVQRASLIAERCQEAVLQLQSRFSEVKEEVRKYGEHLKASAEEKLQRQDSGVSMTEQLAALDRMQALMLNVDTTSTVASVSERASAIADKVAGNVRAIIASQATLAVDLVVSESSQDEAVEEIVQSVIVELAKRQTKLSTELAQQDQMGSQPSNGQHGQDTPRLASEPKKRIASGGVGGSVVF